MGCAVFLALSVARAGDTSRPAKPGKSAAAKPGSKGAPKGSHAQDLPARHSIAGDSVPEDGSLGGQSPDLASMREAERELFPPPGGSQAVGGWPSSQLPPFPADASARVHASGVPPATPLQAASPVSAGDLSWLTHLQMPDLPVRWDERVVRYLQFFRDDARGHTAFANLFRHSGRFRDMMRGVLRRKSLPEDLVWVSMIESAFDPSARSVAGAAGLWQFMPETARIYGLAMDRWVDQRYSAELETAAAAELLADLHHRFGSWELVLAAYNMGHSGLSSVVRRYNTNDFWTLARTEGTLPWETTLYVPKILAASVVAHNLAAFGFADLASDAPLEPDLVDVPPGTSLSFIAQATGNETKDIEALNPELRTARTPPPAAGETHYTVKVPQGKGGTLALALAKLRRDQPAVDRYVVRFGETLEQIATVHKTTIQKLVDLNAIAPGEAVRGGTVLLVPRAAETATATVESGAIPAHGAGAGGPTTSTGPKPNVVVPADEFVYPNRQRVFYRVLAGDTLKEIAAALHVSVDDLCRWNDLDPSARLQEGMTLQGFVQPDADLSGIVTLPEGDVHVVSVGSEEFFSFLEQSKGVRRISVAAAAGDTIESIGRRFDVPARTMERINRRGRNEALRPGETVVVYVPRSQAPAASSGVSASNAPAPNGPLPAPPAPDLLP